jgi:putative sterol carrier protein
MPIPFPSDAWIKALSEQLNASESYERSAKNWEGDFVFIIEPDDVFAETVYLFLGLFHGKSPDAGLLSTPNDREAAYTISAPYTTWRNVVEGKLDPIQGMMTRQLKLQGNMMMIMHYPKAAQEIIACTKTIPTDFAA